MLKRLVQLALEIKHRLCKQICSYPLSLSPNQRTGPALESSAGTRGSGKSARPQERRGPWTPGTPCPAPRGAGRGPRPGSRTFRSSPPPARKRPRANLKPLPPSAPFFFWRWWRLGEGWEDLEGLKERMTRNGGGRLPTNGAATKRRGPRLPSVPPSHTPARTALRTRGPEPGSGGGGDEQGPAGRAAGDSGVAGPHTGAPRLPAHPGPRLRRVARESDLSGSGGRPPPQSGPGPARAPGPGVRAQPAPRAVSAPRAARAPRSYPLACSVSSSLSPSIPHVSWSSSSRLCWLAADSLSSAIAAARAGEAALGAAGAGDRRGGDGASSSP